MAVAVLTKGERTRSRLLQAAEDIFGRVGFHEASISEITQIADVAAGTFYVYFPSKRDILIELIRNRGHQLRTDLHEATKGMCSRAEAEEAGFRTFLEWVRSHPDLYRVVRNAEFVAPEVFREWYQKLGEEYKRALSVAMDSGEIVRTDSEALAYCLMAVGDFTGMRWVLWEDGAKIPPRVFKSVMSFVRRGLGIE